MLKNFLPKGFKLKFSRESAINILTLSGYTWFQLALRNGQDKPQIWVAYKGLIYEVSDSRFWRNGHHYEHWAGQDLTEELKDAPHTEKVFSKWMVVGKLLE